MTSLSKKKKKQTNRQINRQTKIYGLNTNNHTHAQKDKGLQTNKPSKYNEKREK